LFRVAALWGNFCRVGGSGGELLPGRRFWG
jgi:hypothetical protein